MTLPHPSSGEEVTLSAPIPQRFATLALAEEKEVSSTAADSLVTHHWEEEVVVVEEVVGCTAAIVYR